MATKKTATPELEKSMRQTSTGATREPLQGKPDYEGYLSPLVLTEFGQYMLGKQTTTDGHRKSDNWQLGMPKSWYIKSLWRHFMHLLLIHRGFPAYDENGNLVTLRDTLCGIFFNVQGYFHEDLLGRDIPDE
jgi:hypothetical protein